MRVGVSGKAIISKYMEQFYNGRRLRLKTWNGKYIRPRKNSANVQQGGKGKEEIFTILALPQYGPNCIALFTWNRRFLRQHTKKNHFGSTTVDQTGKRKNYKDLPKNWKWERWFVEDVGKGQIALRGYHDRYLRAH